MTPSDTAPSDVPLQASAPAAPTIRRRLMAMVYETFLLVAVEMLAVLLFLVVTRNNQAPVFQHALKAYLFLVTGAYFIHFWCDSGHTLAMKTWRLRLVADGHPRVPLRTAALRYLLAWGWFLPALVACAALGLKGKGEIALAVVIGIAAWALTALFDRDRRGAGRRFLHDRLAGTRIVALPKRR
jgi:uncharacterized RDD family membrane protein YckC